MIGNLLIAARAQVRANRGKGAGEIRALSFGDSGQHVFEQLVDAFFQHRKHLAAASGEEEPAGTAVGVAIEGTRSRTGGLLPGKTGAAYLATRANAPILPMAIWGTEQVISNLKRLRRSTIHVRLGPMIQLPEGRANTQQLEEYTEQLMLTIARMLPPEYRGVYRERITDED